MSELPLHLAIRSLNLEDVDQVVALEELGFPPSERCSPEGVNYRLTACPELSSGLFIRQFKPKYHSATTGSDNSPVVTKTGLETPELADHTSSHDTSSTTVDEEPKGLDDDDDDDNGLHGSYDAYLPEARSTIVSERLIGQVLGTKIDGDFISEESMEIPDGKESASGTKKGHVESSITIGIHSVVVHPDYQKKNLATLLLHDYIQKLSNQHVGEKIAIIAKANLLPFYNRLGFITKGPSKCQHGGEEWFDLHCPLIPEDDDK